MATIAGLDRSGQPQRETPAIVLDCRDHGESDLIVTFFCRQHGRVTGIAKGARRSKKRFVNKLELFTSLVIRHTLPQNNRLAFINEAELLDSFLGLRQNSSSYITASVIREHVLLATKEMEGDEELYPLLIWAFHSLDSDRPPLPTLTFFLVRFFSVIGYSPELEYCSSCGVLLLDSPNHSFYSPGGSMRCSRCTAKESRGKVRLSQGTLKSLVMGLHQPLERLSRLQLSENSRREALTFLHAYGRRLFQREIVSWSFLKEL
ncbi:MAG: DNA repair protein RecO [Thermodesulfobacteriota bacterium]